MSPRRRVLGLIVVAVTAVTVPSCVKDTTLNPYAAPEHGEADRLQKVVNDRPDLEAGQQQLAALDRQIRAEVARYSPETVLGPSTARADRGCTDPYTHTIGDTATIEKIYARPAPTEQQWQQITAALTPILSGAAFTPNSPPGVVPPPGTFTWIADDGATIEMVNSPGTVLSYGYSTGCRLPSAWRTGQPPADRRPVDDPEVHYPYLYGDPGGRQH